MSAHDAVPVSLAEIARIAACGSSRREQLAAPPRLLPHPDRGHRRQSAVLTGRGRAVAAGQRQAQGHRRPGTPLAALRSARQPQRVRAGHRRGGSPDAFPQGADRPSRTLRASPGPGVPGREGGTRSGTARNLRVPAATVAGNPCPTAQHHAAATRRTDGPNRPRRPPRTVTGRADAPRSGVRYRTPGRRGSAGVQQPWAGGTRV